MARRRRREWTRTAALAVCLGVAVGPGWAGGPDEPAVSPAEQVALEATLDAAMTTHALRGVSAAWIRGGWVQWTGGRGTLAGDAPADLASISKSVTAVAALRLVEDGTLSLDAPVTQYLPEAGVPEAVTVRRLLNHTSGLAHYSGPFVGGHFQLADFSKDGAFVREPGAGYGYSSPAYYLLSRVLEAVSGEQYLTLVNRLVAAPLSAPGFEADAVHGHRLGAGGLTARPRTLGTFGGALITGRLLRPESREQLWGFTTEMPGDTARMGLGIMVGPETGRKRKVWHNGSHPDTHHYSRLVLYPGRGEGMAVVVHGTGGASPGKVTTALFAAVKAAGRTKGAPPPDRGMVGRAMDALGSFFGGASR